jgi:predicted dehydrogenase
MTKTRRHLSRRKFLTRTGAAAGAAAAAPYVLTSTALGAAGAVPASERILAGGIGLGGRGSSDLRWLLGQTGIQFRAICDVRRQRRDAIKATVDKRYGTADCATYRDLREFLAARDDLDVVLIATGDRWHALAAMLAMKAGKDVYCEKPGTLTVAEGRALVDTAKRYGRIFQTGTQRLSQSNFVFPTELARTGRLGKLHTVRAHLWSRVKDVTHNAWLPPQPLPADKEFDWDTWLGPVPWRPYNRGYLGGCGAWGIYWDLAAGVAGWGSHTFIQCQFAATCEYTSPVKYEYPGNSSGEGMVTTFANGVKMILQFGGWRGSCGVKFEGTDGSASIADGYAKADVSDPALLGEYQKVMSEYQAKAQRPLDHMQDFLACVRSRRQTIANPEAMHRAMTTNHAINICLALKRDLKWDPAKEAFVGDDEANRMRSRAVRQPWQM